MNYLNLDNSKDENYLINEEADSMSSSPNLEAYKAQQDVLVAKYSGKILAWYNGELVGVFDSKTEAMQEMKNKFEPGSFLIIKCAPGNAEYTRRFRSRVHIIPTLNDYSVVCTH